MHSSQVVPSLVMQAPDEPLSQALFVQRYQADIGAREQEWENYLTEQEDRLRRDIQNNVSLQREYLSDINRQYPASDYMLFSVSPHYQEIETKVKAAAVKRKEALFNYYQEHPESGYIETENKLKQYTALKPEHYKIEKNLNELRDMLHAKSYQKFMRQYSHTVPLDISSLPDEAQVRKRLIEEYDQKRRDFLANPLKHIEDVYLRSKSPRYNPALKRYFLEQNANKAFEAYSAAHRPVTPSELPPLSQAAAAPTAAVTAPATYPPYTPHLQSAHQFPAHPTNARSGLGNHLFGCGVVGAAVGGLVSGIRSQNPLSGFVKGGILGVVAGGINQAIQQKTQSALSAPHVGFHPPYSTSHNPANHTLPMFSAQPQVIPVQTTTPTQVTPTPAVAPTSAAQTTPKHLVVGMGAAGLARATTFADTGSNQDILRAMAEAAVLVVARHGTVDNSVSNLSIAAMGASMRSRVSAIGAQHATHPDQSYQAHTFKRQLNQTLKTMTRITAGQLEAHGVSISKKKLYQALSSHPVLQGEAATVQQNLVRLGETATEGSSQDVNLEAALKRGFVKVFETTLNMVIPSAHPMAHRPIQKTPELSVQQANWLLLLWRSFKGDRSSDVIQFQEHNRQSFPLLYQAHLGNQQGRQAINQTLAQVRRVPSLSFVPDTDTGLATLLVFAGPIQMIPRGVQLTYRWNIARKAANEVFQGGEKYRGQVDEFKKQSIKSLQKSIRSYEKQIVEHEQKIRDPRAACTDRDWDSMSLEHRKNLLEHWKGDIQRASNYQEMAKRVLQEKMQNTNIPKEGIKHVSKKL